MSAVLPQEMPALITAESLPEDYVSDLRRGTVKFDPAYRNFSFHTVTIPDGTEVIGCNFAQAAPNTQAIVGQKLALRECNLVNCALDPSWIVDRCNTVQAWLVTDDQGAQDRAYICGHPDDLTGKEVQPANALVT